MASLSASLDTASSLPARSLPSLPRTGSEGAWFKVIEQIGKRAGSESRTSGSLSPRGIPAWPPGSPALGDPAGSGLGCVGCL